MKNILILLLDHKKVTRNLERAINYFDKFWKMVHPQIANILSPLPKYNAFILNNTSSSDHIILKLTLVLSCTPSLSNMDIYYVWSSRWIFLRSRKEIWVTRKSGRHRCPLLQDMACKHHCHFHMHSSGCPCNPCPRCMDRFLFLAKIHSVDEWRSMQGHRSVGRARQGIF